LLKVGWRGCRALSLGRGKGNREREIEREESERERERERERGEFECHPNSFLRAGVPKPGLPSNEKCPNRLARRPRAKRWAPQRVERGEPGVVLRLPDQAEQVVPAGG
jgi:hypothetical protein